MPINNPKVGALFNFFIICFFELNKELKKYKIIKKEEIKVITKIILVKFQIVGFSIKKLNILK